MGRLGSVPDRLATNICYTKTAKVVPRLVDEKRLNRKADDEEPVPRERREEEEKRARERGSPREEGRWNGRDVEHLQEAIHPCHIMMALRSGVSGRDLCRTAP